MNRLPMPAALLAAALAAASLPAAAQTLTARKPGLWEIKTTHQGGPMAEAQKQMEAAMASMPPAQRKQMEEMMRKQGVGMTGQPGAMRLCVSPAAAARQDFTRPDPKADCQHKVTPVSGSEAKFSFTCKGAGGPSSGEGRVWGLTAEGYQSQMKMQSMHEGKPVTMDMQQTARWLGSDCQGIKPLE